MSQFDPAKNLATSKFSHKLLPARGDHEGNSGHGPINTSAEILDLKNWSSLQTTTFMENTYLVDDFAFLLGERLLTPFNPKNPDSEGPVLSDWYSMNTEQVVYGDNISRSSSVNSGKADIHDSNSNGNSEIAVGDTQIYFPGWELSQAVEKPVGTTQIRNAIIVIDNTINVSFGSGGVDQLVGTSGNDHLQGLAANDIVDGKDGNDLLDGGADSDIIFGGNGDDTLIGQGGHDHLLGDAGDDNLAGGTGADTLRGGADNDTLAGDSSTDILYGNDGDDSLVGGTGADTLYGGTGGDTMFGNTGEDTLYGEDGDDVISAGDGIDLVYGGDGNDLIHGRSGWDILYGDDGDDTLFSSQGSDELWGGRGNDSLSGGTGDDTLYGGDGDDIILGNQGVDVIDGGAGNDALRGGTLLDTFIFTVGHDADRISDFEANQDILQLTTSLTGGRSTGSEVIAEFGSVIGGMVVFDFGNGDTITLENLSSLAGLADNIDII